MYDYYYENLIPYDSLCAHCDPYDSLYFDIETTGLSREKNHIYLIGAAYYTEVGLNIKQWFAESESEEALVIEAFKDFVSSFSYLINFNGKTFDIPFVMKRAELYNIKINLLSLYNIDLYTYVKQYKNILSLNDTKQKTIERFLGINRSDPYTGKELIDVYKKYSGNSYSNTTYSNNKNELLNMLLLHNKEDVLYMHYISQILNYSELSSIECTYVSHCTYEYNSISGEKQQELIIKGTHNFKYINKNVTSIKSIGNVGLALKICKDEIVLRIPIQDIKLNYYFPNYKDYCYLINENICVLKSVAASVKKENKTNVTKEKCCISYQGDYLIYNNSKKALNPCDFKLFKNEYSGVISYIRLEDFENFENCSKSFYINNIISLFF